MGTDVEKLRALRDKLREELRLKDKVVLVEPESLDDGTGEVFKQNPPKKDDTGVAAPSVNVSEEKTIFYIKVFAVIFFVGVLVYVLNDKSSSEKYGIGVKRVQENSGKSGGAFGMGIPKIFKTEEPLVNERTEEARQKEKKYGLDIHKTDKTKDTALESKELNPVQPEEKTIEIKESEMTDLVIKTEKLLGVEIKKNETGGEN